MELRRLQIRLTDRRRADLGCFGVHHKRLNHKQSSKFLDRKVLRNWKDSSQPRRLLTESLGEVFAKQEFHGRSTEMFAVYLATNLKLSTYATLAIAPTLVWWLTLPEDSASESSPLDGGSTKSMTSGDLAERVAAAS